MNKVHIYCGHYQYIPYEIRQSMIVLGQCYDTCAEMSNRGHNLVKYLNDYNVDQIFFTNNDHVFNGLRVAVMKSHKAGLDYADRIVMHYFDDHKEETLIHIDKDGRCKDWPRGFFDQIENDLIQLI